MIDWKERFLDLGAYWEYPGKPRAEQAHCLLTSGNHSNGFFNGTKVMENPLEAQVACAYLLQKVGQSSWKDVQWVFGPAQGAITMAYQLAANIGCRAGFSEKGETGDEMVIKRFDSIAGLNVLVCEDVTTTGGTTIKNVTALQKIGAKVLPMVFTLVNRSGLQDIVGIKIVALIDRELPTWSADSCPYCEAGSKPLRPKLHWTELTGQGS